MLARPNQRRFAAGIASRLKLRFHDGSQFVADDYQRELASLDIEISPAFARKPEGKGGVKRFIRVLKENLPCRFDTIEEVRLALHRFKDIYNHNCVVERHSYRIRAQGPPDQLGLAPAA